MIQNKDGSVGIYIHIPFCVRKCNYCDFLSAPADENTQELYLRALLEEIVLTGQQIREDTKRGESEAETVSSIFFGGGTPSLWSAEWIKKVLDTVRDYFVLEEQAEITVECNPGTLTKEKAEGYRRSGVNRLSIGLQSADNQLLSYLGRIHTYEEFLESFQIARTAGFSNLNVDIMSALPMQSMEDYENTLRKVLALSPEHISAYSLIVEEGTPFYEQELMLPDEDTERQMYYRTKELLCQYGYERYEISNYAKAGFACRHNLIYWNTQDYLGFGIGAASLYRGVRYQNRTDLQEYCRLLLGVEKRADREFLLNKKERSELLERLRAEVHELSKQEQMEEFCFLGLRKMSGISENEFEQRFAASFLEIYGEVVRKYETMGLLVRLDEDRIILTDKGIDVSNVVLADFLL